MKKNISVKRFLAPDGDHHTTTTFIRRTLRWMMALLALLFAIAIGALVSIAGNLNDQADAQSALLLKKALDNRLERLVTHTNDNAWWSEAYENLHIEVNTDWAYSRENLGASQYSDFGYEGLFVIDGQGHTRYSVIRGKLSSLSLTQWLGSDPLPLIHAGLKPDESESSTSARFLLNGNLALLAASTLSAGNGGHVSPVTGPPSLLVFVDVLGPQKLAALGNEYGIQQVRVAQGDTAHGPRLGTLRVPLPSGEVTLAWRSAEPGRQLLRYILPLLLALGVITGLSAVFMMRSALNKARLYDENNFLLEQHRQALTASERRFRDVAEATTDWIWETDAQLNFTYLSERFPQHHWPPHRRVAGPASDGIHAGGQRVAGRLDHRAGADRPPPPAALPLPLRAGAPTLLPHRPETGDYREWSGVLPRHRHRRHAGGGGTSAGAVPLPA